MRIHRICVAPEDVGVEWVVFSDRASHYLRNVLRLGLGDRVQAFDGTRECLVEVALSDKGSTAGRILEIRQEKARHTLGVILAVSCVRPGPFEEILRHGTELGISRFIPVLSARATRRPTEKKDRWESVVKAAAQQSGRVSCPEVEPPLGFERLLERQMGEHTRFILSLHERARPMIHVLAEDHPDRVLVLIGPEGGFDAAEEAKAFDGGFKPVSLGPGVLRTETAAVVAAGMLQLWHDSVCRQVLPAMPGGAKSRGESCKTPLGRAISID